MNIWESFPLINQEKMNLYFSIMAVGVTKLPYYYKLEFDFKNYTVKQLSLNVNKAYIIFSQSEPFAKILNLK